MPVFTLHGYFRVRGELQDNFFLGRDGRLVGVDDYPFTRFVPADRNASAAGGCATLVTDPNQDTSCSGSSDRLRFANMRLRLDPTIALSDDVRVHVRADIFDNLVLGSTPDSRAYVPAPNGTVTRAGASGQPRVPGVPVDTFTNGQQPPEHGRNSLQDSIVIRRAWAEVTNRGIGQLRFGRMGNQWGLGMLWNSGDGIDSDYSSEVDRVMGITKLAGFYFGASWDFADEGLISQPVSRLAGIPFDATQRDDIRQYSLLVAHRLEPEEQRARLERGDWVLNGGLYFILRKQGFSSAPAAPFAQADPTQGFSDFVRRNARMYIPDIWVQFLWKSLRLELEMATVAGRVRNIFPDFQNDEYKLRQLGFAFESEYRVLDDKLGVYFKTGLATGDSDVDGLSIYENTAEQRTTGANNQVNHRLSQFTFNPNYRVDLILFRNILGSVGGAYYFRPGISYDIIHNAFGRLFGARVDFIYSRAAKAAQTYGDDGNLGFEIDTSLYYRSEDGPDLLDGFYAAFNYGVLFPLAGLDYRSSLGVSRGVSRAQTLRLLLGVEF